MLTDPIISTLYPNQYHQDILIVLFICCRREAVSVHVGRLHVEIRTIGRADAALSQTHGPKTVQVPSLSAIVFAERPLVAPHEEALMVRAPSRAARRERERTPIGGKKWRKVWRTVLGNRLVIPSDPRRETTMIFLTFGTWRAVPRADPFRTLGRPGGQQLGKRENKSTKQTNRVH